MSTTDLHEVVQLRNTPEEQAVGVRRVRRVMPESTCRILEFVVQRDEGMDDAWVGAASAKLWRWR